MAASPERSPSPRGSGAPDATTADSASLDTDGAVARVIRAIPVPLAATPLVIVLTQVMAIVVAAPFLSTGTAAIGDLVTMLGQEQRPTLASTLPLAQTLVTALAVVVGASAAGSLVAYVVMVTWVHRAARRRLPLSRLTARQGAASVGVIGASALVGMTLTAVIGSLGAEVVITEARGTIITVVLPSAALIASVLVVAAVVVVTGAILVPLAMRAVPSTPTPTPTRTRDAIDDGPGARRGAQGRLPIGLPIAVVALTTAFIVIAAVARPISDDYRVMALVREMGFVDYLVRHLALETGRYSQGVSNWVLATLFGSAVNLGTALVVFVAVLTACASALHTFLPRVREAGRGAGWWLAGGFAVLAVYLVPSLADTWLWFTSADVYMPSVAAFLFGAALVRRAWTGPQTGWQRWALLAAVVAVVLLTQGYSEATSALAWACASLLVVVAFRRSDAHPRVVSLVVWLTATAGLLMLAFAPAQFERSGNVDSGNAVVGVLGGVYSVLPLGNRFGLHGWMLMIGLALCLAIVLRPWVTRRQLSVMATVGASALTLVPPMGGLVAFLGLNWAPWRTLTLPAVAFAWGFVLLLAAVLVVATRVIDARRAARSERPLRPARVSAVAAVTMIAATVATSPLVGSTLVAGAVRMQMIAARDAIVVEQLAAGAGEITVHPAPLLIYPSDSRDFEFLEVQNKDWFFVGYRNWYAVPPETVLAVVTTQPLGYCVTDERIILPNVRPCDEMSSADD